MTKFAYSDTHGSDRGWSEGGKTQIASNVTTLSRALRRQCSEDTVQIIYYQAGVGTGPSWLDTVKGGAFGIGVAEVRRSWRPAKLSSFLHLHCSRVEH